MSEQINKFFISFAKKKFQISIWKNNKIIISKKKNLQSFIFGYKDANDKGEFISINYNTYNLILKNDENGTCPCYIYNDKKNIYLSNSIDEIARYQKLEINSKLLKKYFFYGFLPDDFSTIYKNIKILKPNTHIKINDKFLIKENFKNIFFRPKRKIGISKLTQSLKKSVEEKIKFLKKEKIALMLTSGFDSLLSIAILKDLNFRFQTATFGTMNSFDKKIASIRSKEFFKIRNDYFNLKKKNIRADELKKFSRLVGGISNLSAINLMFFTNYLKKKYTYHLYSDHYESTRRKFNSLESLVKNYETNKLILTRNLSSIFQPKLYFNEIKKLHKGNPYSFYYYGRYINGAAHARTNIVNSLGCIKVNLPIDKEFLLQNYFYNATNRHHSYEKLFMKNKINIRNLNISKSINVGSKDKIMPYDAKFLIKRFPIFFINQLKKSKKNNFHKYFKIDQIIEKIKNCNFIKNEEWLILRLMSLIIFSNIYDIKIK